MIPNFFSKWRWSLLVLEQTKNTPKCFIKLHDFFKRAFVYFILFKRFRENKNFCKWIFEYF